MKMASLKAPMQARLPAHAKVVISAAFALAAIAAVQARAYLNHDVGWFVRGAEQMMQGAVLGRDLIEPNFPLAYLIYMPAEMIGQFIGISAGVKLWLLLLSALSLAMALPRLYRPARLDQRNPAARQQGSDQSGDNRHQPPSMWMAGWLGSGRGASLSTC